MPLQRFPKLFFIPATALTPMGDKVEWKITREDLGVAEVDDADRGTVKSQEKTP